MIATISNKFLKVTIKSSGAEMVSIKNAISEIEYLWQGNPEFWARRAPVLFPIVGKVKDNIYTHEGQVYELPQHGFARDMFFDILDKQESSVTYILKSNEQTLKVYPFRFELSINYSLEDNKLFVIYSVKNTDEKPLWFSIGAHPAFNCPIENGESFSDYYLEFDKPETASRVALEGGLLKNEEKGFLKNEKIINLSEKLFDDDAIIFRKLSSKKVSLKSGKSKNQITMDFSDFPYMAFWSKKGGAPFVCLEPWHGIADKVDFAGELADKEGIKRLAEGETFTTEFSVEFFGD